MTKEQLIQACITKDQWIDTYVSSCSNKKDSLDTIESNITTNTKNYYKNHKDESRYRAERVRNGMEKFLFRSVVHESVVLVDLFEFVGVGRSFQRFFYVHISYSKTKTPRGQAI